VALAVRSAPPGVPQKSKLRRSTATARKGHAIVTVHHDGRVAEPGGISRAKVRVKDLHSHTVRALLASRALLVKIKRNLENQIRGLLKNLALVIGRAKFSLCRAGRGTDRGSSRVDRYGRAAISGIVRHRAGLHDLQ
jgi:hypothetical protein